MLSWITGQRLGEMVNMEVGETVVGAWEGGCVELQTVEVTRAGVCWD